MLKHSDTFKGTNMDILREMRESPELTPAEQQLAQTILDLGERLQSMSIKELARVASVSISSVHRLCKKLGLEGYKELKVAYARAMASQGPHAIPVDINFPFSAGDGPSKIAARMTALYESTLVDTLNLIDQDSLAAASQLMANAQRIDIYAHSHNIHPAQMFEERLISIGKHVSCPTTWEREIRCALGSKEGHVALIISYSGISSYVHELLPVLKERGVPVVFIGSPAVKRRHPNLSAYLFVSDRESLQNRITQFSSHIAVQFVLDTLYSCIFALDYERDKAFLTDTIPYTMLGRHHPVAMGIGAKG